MYVVLLRRGVISVPGQNLHPSQRNSGLAARAVAATGDVRLAGEGGATLDYEGLGAVLWH